MNVSIARPRVAGPYLLLVAALAFAAWFMLASISRPGLQYDEALFVNAALGGPYENGTFISARFLGVPTMLMPYIGALKAWLYVPVFGLFGVSVATIRLPMIAIVLATTVLAFVLARRLFGPWPASLLAVIMATDPVYLTMAKADWGPVAVSGLLRLSALLAYVSWLRTGSARRLWLLSGLLVLGVWNKLDFLSFVVALTIAAAVVHHREIVAIARRSLVGTAAAGGALVVALAFVFVQIYLPAKRIALNSQTSLGGRPAEVWRLFRGTADGSGVYQYMTTRSLHHPSGAPVMAVGAILLAGVVVVGHFVMSRRGVRETGAALTEAVRYTTFFLVLSVSMVAVLTVTPQAVGPHHIVLLWPLPAILAASLLAVAGRARRPRVRRAGVGVLVLAVACSVATQVRAAGEYRRDVEGNEALSPIWTAEIYPLTRAVTGAARGVDGIVVADWGIGNQLLALGNDDVRRRLADVWPSFIAEGGAGVDNVTRTRLAGHRTIVVAHRQGREIMPGSSASVDSVLASLRPARGMTDLYQGHVLRAYVVDDRAVP